MFCLASNPLIMLKLFYKYMLSIYSINELENYFDQGTSEHRRPRSLKSSFSSLKSSRTSYALSEASDVRFQIRGSILGVNLDVDNLQTRVRFGSSKELRSASKKGWIQVQIEL